jgi:hypothetical protein
VFGFLSQSAAAVLLEPLKSSFSANLLIAPSPPAIFKPWCFCLNISVENFINKILNGNVATTAQTRLLIG